MLHILLSEYFRCTLVKLRLHSHPLKRSINGTPVTPCYPTIIHRTWKGKRFLRLLKWRTIQMVVAHENGLTQEISSSATTFKSRVLNFGFFIRTDVDKIHAHYMQTLHFVLYFSSTHDRLLLVYITLGILFVSYDQNILSKRKMFYLFLNLVEKNIRHG